MWAMFGSDFDECSVYGTCSQSCTNTLGSYSCSCVEGYLPQPDNRSCKAKNGKQQPTEVHLQGPHQHVFRIYCSRPVPVDRLPVLLIANSQNIQASSLSGTTVHSLLSTSTKQTTAMDFLYAEETVCWIHVGDSPVSTHLKCAKIPNLKSFTEDRVINISLSLHSEYTPVVCLSTHLSHGGSVVSQYTEKPSTIFTSSFGLFFHLFLPLLRSELRFFKKSTGSPCCCLSVMWTPWSSSCEQTSHTLSFSSHTKEHKEFCITTMFPPENTLHVSAVQDMKLQLRLVHIQDPTSSGRFFCVLQLIIFFLYLYHCAKQQSNMQRPSEPTWIYWARYLLLRCSTCDFMLVVVYSAFYVCSRHLSSQKKAINTDWTVVGFSHL